MTIYLPFRGVVAPPFGEDGNPRQGDSTVHSTADVCARLLRCDLTSGYGPCKLAQAIEGKLMAAIPAFLERLEPVLREQSLRQVFAGPALAVFNERWNARMSAALVGAAVELTKDEISLLRRCLAVCGDRDAFTGVPSAWFGPLPSRIYMPMLRDIEAASGTRPELPDMPEPLTPAVMAPDPAPAAANGASAQA